MDTAPADREDIKEECRLRIAVFSEFAPKQMGEDEIQKVIDNVLKELGLSNPTAKEKGLIMKSLMPKVKGKADGALVGKLVSARLN